MSGPLPEIVKEVKPVPQIIADKIQVEDTQEYWVRVSVLSLEVDSCLGYYRRVVITCEESCPINPLSGGLVKQ